MESCPTGRTVISRTILSRPPHLSFIILPHTEEKNDGRTNIGFWDDPAERVHWLARISEAGTYDVAGEFAASGISQLVLEVDGKTVKFSVPRTGGWDKPRTVKIGQFEFDKPGVYHLILGAADPEAWKAVNVWQLQFAPRP